MFLKIKDVKNPYNLQKQSTFVGTLSRQTHFWDTTTVPCGSEKSHNVVRLNPDENKYYFLTPYTTLMQPLKKFSPESIRAIAHNPNIDLQSIGIYSNISFTLMLPVYASS